MGEVVEETARNASWIVTIRKGEVVEDMTITGCNRMQHGW